MTDSVDLLDSAPERPALPVGTVLVPGIVTRYKDPAAVLGLLDLLRDSEAPVSEVPLAGGDDGSGCLEHVRLAAAAGGARLRQRVVERAEVLAACRIACAVMPNRLESRALSGAEAQILSPMVQASDLPAHREIAERSGREPSWLDTPGPVAAGTPRPPEPETRAAGWARLGRAVGVPTSTVRNLSDRQEPPTK